nr:hypothetical protein CFP56_78161 [Quercus suber]
MGRGRGKGKKLTVTNHEDGGSGEEEKIPAQKRRGRPQKPLKDEIDEEEVEKIDKEIKSPSATENGKKRKRNSHVKEKADSVKEENGNGTRSSTDDSIKSNGFRLNGSRRKSKPRRAAEAGVEFESHWGFSNTLLRYLMSRFRMGVLSALRLEPNSIVSIEWIKQPLLVEAAL